MQRLLRSIIISGYLRIYMSIFPCICAYRHMFKKPCCHHFIKLYVQQFRESCHGLNVSLKCSLRSWHLPWYPKPYIELLKRLLHEMIVSSFLNMPIYVSMHLRVRPAMYVRLGLRKPLLFKPCTTVVRTSSQERSGNKTWLRMHIFVCIVFVTMPIDYWPMQPSGSILVRSPAHRSRQLGFGAPSARWRRTFDLRSRQIEEPSHLLSSEPKIEEPLSLFFDPRDRIISRSSFFGPKDHRVTLVCRLRKWTPIARRRCPSGSTRPCWVRPRGSSWSSRSWSWWWFNNIWCTIA